MSSIAINDPTVARLIAQIEHTRCGITGMTLRDKLVAYIHQEIDITEQQIE